MKASRFFTASIGALAFGMAVSSLQAENLRLNFRSRVETDEGTMRFTSRVFISGAERGKNMKLRAELSGGSENPVVDMEAVIHLSHKATDE